MNHNTSVYPQLKIRETCITVSNKSLKFDDCPTHMQSKSYKKWARLVVPLTFEYMQRVGSTHVDSP